MSFNLRVNGRFKLDDRYMEVLKKEYGTLRKNSDGEYDAPPDLLVYLRDLFIADVQNQPVDLAVLIEAVNNLTVSIKDLGSGTMVTRTVETAPIIPDTSSMKSEVVTEPKPKKSQQADVAAIKSRMQKLLGGATK